MRTCGVLAVALCAWGLWGCSSTPSTSDGAGRADGTVGLDAVVALDVSGVDAEPRPDSAVDAPDSAADAGDDGLDARADGDDAGPADGEDAGPAADAAPDATAPDSGVAMSSTPAPAATIARAGTGGLLLRGAVLTPTGVLDPGEVLVSGNMIACVAADCSAAPGASTATIIETHATISPGLIDGHNHLTYSFLPAWAPSPPRLFANRYEWRSDPQFQAHVEPEGDADVPCAGAKWGELRSIIHGTTTVQGQARAVACLDRLARNADSYTGLGPAIARATISGPCESGFPTRASLVSSFSDGTTTRFYVHMGEGYANVGAATRTNPLREFDCYDGTDPTYYTAMSLLDDPTGMPFGTAVFIHAMPLTPAQLDRTLAARAHVVWSPSSNVALYGQTADIAGMLARGIPVGIGPDWTLSGSDELLSELRFAQRYGADHGVAALTAERLWRMSTVDGADVVGLAAIGTLAVGQRADITVFGRVSSAPHQAVIDSRAADVRLVLIDGVGYYGDAALQAATAVNASCEAFDACGTPKYLCAANTPGSMTATSRSTETVADIQGQLTAVLAAHGRTDLLPLVDCSL